MTPLPPFRLVTRRGARRGSVIVEFTLSSLFLITLFLGVWQYGYSYYIYGELEQAVRDGARYASVQTYDSATTTPSNPFLTAVQNVVVYGEPAPAAGSAPLAPALITGNVSLAVTFSAGGAPTNMTVAITGYQVPTYFGNKTLNGKPTTSFPFVGTFGPP